MIMSNGTGELDDCGRPSMFLATHKSAPIALDGMTFESLAGAETHYTVYILDLFGESV